MASMKLTWPSRLKAKIAFKSSNDCWLWTGAVNNKGYGFLQIGRGIGTKLAHRMAYILWKGKIPKGKVLRHKCDNPRCCNPKHLIAGTKAENSADMVARGRHVGYRKISSQDVVAIRKRLSDGFRQQDIADNFGITQSQVSNIKRGHSW